MGMSKLSEITTLFKNESKHEVPVAIIQSGTTPEEKIGIGTIATIETVVEQQKLTNPAIIVIGEVVNNREKILEISSQVATV